MTPLVSVIIPCYNAERWVAEAIQSCLGQTYQPIEIIVIDDGSTDRSLEVIKSFGQTIRWETGSNRGGNHARNRGFALARGEFTQFLDADDYLLPQKIEQQVGVLNKSGAEVVYEDWQRLQENTDGSSVMLPPEISGMHTDMLEAMLGGWATPPCALLFTRAAVEKSGGWDEELTSSQDWDLNIRAALAGVAYVYAPGCNSVYRRPAVATVSTRNQRKNDDNINLILKAAEARLQATNRLTDNYKAAIARTYFRMARNYFDTDRARFQVLLSEAQRLSRNYVVHESRLYRLMAGVFGVAYAEQFCSIKRRLRKTRVNAC